MPRPRNDGSTAMFLISLCCASSASTSWRCPTTRSPADCDEHLPGVEIGVELRRGVLGHREQRSAARRAGPRGARRAPRRGRAGRARCLRSTATRARSRRSGRGGSSSIARYSSRCPSGSRKYTAAAGIQPITLGSVVSAAKNESGVTPRARRRSHAPSTSSSDALKATCNDSPMGADPSDQRPSIASPGSPIQKNAAPRSGASSASGRPTTSR